jgi:hypothetical protein
MAIALDNLTLTAEQLRAEHRRTGSVDHVRLRRGATSAPPTWARPREDEYYVTTSPPSARESDDDYGPHSEYGRLAPGTRR